jgi:UDP-galactopyranose mutase
VPTAANRQTYLQYQKEAEETEKNNNVYFVGRLANYKYMNMDEAIQNAMDVYDKFQTKSN